MADLAFLDPRRRPRPLLRTLVGGVLRRHRQEQGRTLADVSRAARVSMPYLSELERGRKEASSEVLAAVCAALRIDLSDLLAEVWHDLAAEPAGVLRREPAGVLRREPAGLLHREPAGERDRAWPRRAPEPGRPTAAVSDRRVARPARRSADIVLLAA
jgi:transcriptional regulator with XRE-family HTH domain